jgi:hypothetical protein
VSTLIGMVQMFANMTDRSKLGPFMAVALPAPSTATAQRGPPDSRSGGMPSVNFYAVAARPTPIRCSLTTRSLPPTAA